MASIAKGDIIELASMNHPASNVRDSLLAMLCLFKTPNGFKKKHIREGTTEQMWHEIKNFIRHDTFIDELLNFDKENVPHDNVLRAQFILKQERFNNFQAEKYSKALSGIHNWVKAVIMFHNSGRPQSTKASGNQRFSIPDTLESNYNTQPVNGEERKVEDNPFGVSSTVALESITTNELNEVLSLKNIPIQLVKSWLAIYVLLNGHSDATKKMASNNFKGAWEFVTKYVKKSNFIQEMIDFDATGIDVERAQFRDEVLSSEEFEDYDSSAKGKVIDLTYQWLKQTV